MKSETGSGVELTKLGAVDTALEERACMADSCGGAPATSLDHQLLCVNHFLLRCYDQLERLDPRGRRLSREPFDMLSMRAFIEECSRKALDVSLQSESLSNLQRGRLLDILLWAGELFVLLRVPRFTLAQSMAFAESHTAAHTVSPCY